MSLVLMGDRESCWNEFGWTLPIPVHDDSPIHIVTDYKTRSSPLETGPCEVPGRIMDHLTWLAGASFPPPSKDLPFWIRPRSPSVRPPSHLTQPQSHSFFLFELPSTNTLNQTNMKSPILLVAVVVVCLLVATLTMAGTIKDTAAIVTGTVGSLGLYVPYKMFGVVARCRREQNQNSEACLAQDGCQWNMIKNKCRAAGLLGLRQYYQDRNNECKLFTDKQSCDKSEACDWSHIGSKGCYARVLNTLRNTRREGKIPDWDAGIEKEFQGLGLI